MGQTHADVVVWSGRGHSLNSKDKGIGARNTLGTGEEQPQLVQSKAQQMGSTSWRGFKALALLEEMGLKQRAAYPPYFLR